MRWTLGLIVIACLLSLPLASAQVPDPGAVIGTACGLVRGTAPDVADQVPLCPGGEPAAPAAPGQDAPHDHPDAPADVPANPQDAEQLADQVAGDVQQIPDDPATAPDHALAIVATVIQFVKDLLHLPVVAGQNIGAGLASAAGAVGAAAHATAGAIGHAAQGAGATIGQATQGAAHAVGDAAHSAVAHVAALFHHAPPAAPSHAPASGVDHAVRGLDARGKRLVDDVLGSV